MKYSKELISIIRHGKYAVIPTDTIYGIVGRALDPLVVENLYDIRDRARSKPFIVLIAQMTDLAKFGVDYHHYQNIFNQYWPGPFSLILANKQKEFEYLHRGTNSLAFRMPANEDLRILIEQTGPLVAPSANLAGEPAAKNIIQAQKYFGDKVAIYVDGGEIIGNPSSVIKINEDGNIEKIR